MMSNTIEDIDRYFTLDTSFRTVNDDRLQELIRQILLVVLLYGLHNVLSLLSLSLHKPINSDLDPLPSLVAIHSIIPSNHGRNLPVALLFDEVEKILRVPYR